MISNPVLFSMMCLVPALLCSYLLFRTSKENLSLWLLFLNLAVMDLCLAIGYLSFAITNEIIYAFADTYLILVSFMFAQFFVVANSFGGKQLSELRFLYLAPLVVALLLLSGFISDGYIIERNSLVHIDGQLGWVFDLQALTFSLGTCYVLYRNRVNSKNQKTKRLNTLALYSFLPIVVSFAVLDILSVLNSSVPAVLVGPIVTTYTAIAFFIISKKTPIKISESLRSFVDRQRLKIAIAVLGVSANKEGVKEASKKLERYLVAEQLRKNNNDIVATSEDFGASTTHVRTIVKEL